MTTLHLIRHGRALAQAEDYDQLHELGELQARLLGAHLLQRGQRFDAVYVGPLRRQLETLRLMREAGAVWPKEIVIPEVAEGPFELLFKKYLKQRLESDPVVKAHVARLHDFPEERDDILEALFAHMITLWHQAAVQGEGLETAAAFDARIGSAISQIAAREGYGKHVAVVTSNGVIGGVVRRAFGEPDGRRMRVHNSSVTRIELTQGGLVLHAHDVTEHLSDPAHLTLL